MSKKPFIKISALGSYAMIALWLVIALATLWFGSNMNPKVLDFTAPRNKPDALAAPLDQAGASRGIYDWRGPEAVSEAQADADFSRLKREGFTVVYADVSSYIDSYELSDTHQKAEALNSLDRALRTYVSTAGNNGLSVQALAGDTAWGFADNAYIQQRFIDFVHTYNAKSAKNENLGGLQFDIEIYNDPAFAGNKKDALDQYLQSVISATEYYKGLDDPFALGYTMPYWYDNENNNIPSITYNHKLAPIAYHLFDTLNGVDGAYAVIMDYRNVADGSDGSVAHAQNEIVYSSKYTKAVKIIIAQETTDVQPSKITFFGKRYSDFISAALSIDKTYEPYRTYAGLAVNDIEGFERLYKNQ